MLVLSGQSGERIFLGDDIEVIVLEVRGDRVSLGFNAPGYLPIQRSERHLGHDMERWFHVLADAECA